MHKKYSYQNNNNYGYQNNNNYGYKNRNNNYGYQNYGYEDKKGSKWKIVIIIFFLLFLFLGVALAYLFFKKSTTIPEDTLVPPTNLKSKGHDTTSIVIGYDSVDGDGITYDIRWTENSGSYSENWEEESFKETEYTITSLTEDTMYFIEVRSNNTETNKKSKWSNELSQKTDSTTTPVIPVPQDLSVSTQGSYDIDVTYSPVTLGSDNIKYDVRWSKTSDGYSEGWIKEKIDSTSYTISSLDPETMYYVEVRANDITTSNTSDWSSEVSTQTDPAPPIEVPVPQNLSATTKDTSSIDVSYNSVSLGSDTIKYDLRWSKTSGGYTEGWTQTEIDSTSYTISSLDSGTTYYIEVRANDVTTSNTSAWSNEVSSQTDSEPVVIPVPENLSATTKDTSSIDVSYNSVSLGSDTIKYDVRWSKTGGGYTEEWIQTEIDSTSYTISSLDSNTTYYIEVRANDITASDTSAWSSEVSAQTDSSHVGPDFPDIKPQPKEFESDWGTGTGHIWKDKAYAPFVDAAITPPPLTDWSGQMGADYFNLGFIQSVDSQVMADGTLNWGWGGFASLSEKGADSQYNKIKEELKKFRDQGGDYTISFGGATGTSFWNLPTATVDNLAATYESIIKGYGLSRIDLDIEGPVGEDLAANVLNAQAIKKVQDKTGVQIVLTLPTLTGGLDGKGYPIAKAYIDAGVKITAINIMSMYITPVGGDAPGDIISSIEGLNHNIIQLAREQLGIELTKEQAYHYEGVTPSIGYENSSWQSLSNDGWDAVAKYADEHELAILSDWVENRDALQGWYGDTQTGHASEGGITVPWQYGNTGRNDFNDEYFPHDPPSPPSEITNFAVTDKTFGGAKLTWDDTQPDDVETRIYFAKDGDKQYELLDTVNNTSSYDVTGLDPSTSYWALLASVNSNGDHKFSEPINFSTEDMPVDTDPPEWNGSQLTIDSTQSSPTTISMSFGNATDNIGVKKYIVTLSKGATEVTTKELTPGVDFDPAATNIVTSLNNLSLSIGQAYDIKVNAYDYNNNKSTDITNTYSPEYPDFDYSKSDANTYKVGDIVKFTSTDSDWVSAGIGEKLYKKINAWGQGWAPDGSTSQNPNNTDYSPGHTDANTTGWDLYTPSYSENNKYITSESEYTDDSKEVILIDKNNIIDYKINK